MKVINLTQGSHEWLKWRAEGISATDIPIILGKSPYKTPYQLWLEKTGRANPDDLSRNPNVKRGVKLEPAARDYCEKRDKEIILPVCIESTELPILRASLDGLSSKDIPYELKAPSEKRWQELVELGTESETYKLYEWQVKTQCVVADAVEGLLIFYMDDVRNLDFRITVSSEDRQSIFDAATAFKKCIDEGTPPSLDPDRDMYIPDSGEDEFRWQAYVELYRQNQAKIDSLKKSIEPLNEAQDELKEAIFGMMGDFKITDYAGLKVTRFDRQGSIDYKKLCKEQNIEEELVETYRKPSSVQSRVALSDSNKLNDEVIGNESEPVQTSAYF